MILKYITLSSGFSFTLLALVAFIKQFPNKRANNILGVLLLLMAIYCGLIFFHYTALINLSYVYLKYYAPIDGLFLLLMGPGLYFYTSAALNKPIKLMCWHTLIHLPPLLPCLIFNICFSFYSFEQRIDWLVRDFKVGTIEINVLNIILYVQMGTYLLMSYALTKKQLKDSSTVIINNFQMDISWLKTFLLINLGFIFLSAPLCFYFANERTNIIIGQLGMDIQFVYLFFKSTLQKDALPVCNQLSVPCTDNTIKLDDTLAEKHLNKLIVYMNEQKPYLIEDCSIQSLSDGTGISSRHLSAVLNTKLEKTSPDFINEYRIAEAKEILLSDVTKLTTIEAISITCGFGSKTNFNRAFKKHTNNLTPSEFRKQINQK